MDTFENNDFQPEAEPAQPQDVPAAEPASAAEPAPAVEPAPAAYSQPDPRYSSWQSSPNTYHGAGTGRKESPFADSPYMQGYPPQGSYRQPEFRYIPNSQPEQPRKPKEKPAGKRGFWKTALAAALILALVAGSCGITAWSVNSYWESRDAKNQQTLQELTNQITDLQNQISGFGGSASGGHTVHQPPVVTDGSQMNPGQLYSACVDSVVAISCTVQSTTFGQITEGHSAGSGFILSEDGYIVTNHHVISGATSISVVTNDGESYTATLVGSDDTNDVAVLKVDATGLPAVSLGSSNALYIGDMVVAIGNPLGELTATQTVGYVSGTNREVTTDNTIINMIQTDAAINPGNSGGPLFDMYGQVVGITTAKYSGTTSSGASIEGIGFAIPIDDVKGIISDLIEYGYVTGAYMGVTVRNMDPTYADMYGLPMGAYIDSVEAGSAAEKAGIRAKDIVIGVDDYEIESMNDLTLVLRNYKAGDSATVTLVRGGLEMTVTITFDERPNTTQSTAPEADSSMPSSGDYEEWYDYFFSNPGRGGD